MRERNPTDGYDGDETSFIPHQGPASKNDQMFQTITYSPEA